MTAATAYDASVQATPSRAAFELVDADQQTSFVPITPDGSMEIQDLFDFPDLTARPRCHSFSSPQRHSASNERGGYFPR
jgi:hypothetical protein